MPHAFVAAMKGTSFGITQGWVFILHTASIGPPTGVQGSKALGLPLFSQPTSRELMGSGAARTLTGMHIGSWHLQGKDFSH